MARVLVTGALGSLGSKVSEYLKSKGHDVVTTDMKRVGANQHLDHRIDLTNREDTFHLFWVASQDEAIDYVIHAAANVYGVAGFHDRPATILGDDVAMMKNVLDASLWVDAKKVIFISSSMVYEQSLADISSEDVLKSDKFRVPVTEYGLSKYVNEKMLEAYHKQYGLKYTIWRPFNIITPYESASGDIGERHVFADFIHAIVSEQRTVIPIIGDGEQIRCFTWIDEVVQAIGDYSFDSRTDNEDFNLGIYEPVTMRELAQCIYQEAQTMYLSDNGPLQFITVKSFTDDVKVRIVSSKKAKDILGWEAKISLKESVRECLWQYYKQLKW